LTTTCDPPSRGSDMPIGFRVWLSPHDGKFTRTPTSRLSRTRYGFEPSWSGKPCRRRNCFHRRPLCH
jgi:hypothetical protein